jgi:DNA polymerase elongation subunit (family B)
MLEQLKPMIKKVNYFEVTKKQEFKEAKILVFDIETILINDVQIPYLFSLYNGKQSFSWFADIKNPKSAVDSLFKELLRPKYEGYQLYAHNLSGFDINFIWEKLALLSKDYSVGIMKRENKILSITINKKHISLTIKDSFLLLPSSLKSLCKNFGTSTQKGLEPVLISGINIDPESLQYVNSSVNHYNKDIEIIQNNSNEDFMLWKTKIQSYCEDDCISLYQVLIKFRNLIYSNFGVLIDFNPTTPSVAFSIFKSGYLTKETIQCIDGGVDKFIRKSYTGGSTDMIIPLPEKDELVYVYDVNSFYPSQMAKHTFPAGKVIHFNNLDEVQGGIWFAKVIVTSLKDLEIPYLQIHHKGRTISPLGTFEMTISSVEYYNALKNNDYSFKIIEGYYFENERYIFKTYVEELYKLRLNYDKSHPMNYIAKLLMNSLYGRFGMKLEGSQVMFADDKKISKLKGKATISKIEPIIRDINLIELEVEELLGLEVNVAIASYITSLSRVALYRYKKYCIDNGIKIFYFDTDSIFTNKPLPEQFISNKLGDLKLEYIFKKSIFLAPKMYGGITTDNKEVMKLKGFKNAKNVGLDKLKLLLQKDFSFKLKHLKWFKNINEGRILIKDSDFTLQQTASKRDIIYSKGLAIATKPKILE